MSHTSATWIVRLARGPGIFLTLFRVQVLLRLGGLAESEDPTAVQAHDVGQVVVRHGLTKEQCSSS